MKQAPHPRLQHAFTPFVVVFLLLGGLGLAAALWFTDSGATITITPKGSTLSATLLLKVSDRDSAEEGVLKAAVTEEELSATVEATPPAEGVLIDARAAGTMTVVNNSTQAQPLAAGTRFRSESGVIFRSAARVDVPAGGRVSIRVVADPTGVSGNVPAGRFVIVALWPGLQDRIFGETSSAMTGGQIREGSTLDVASLTEASNKAEEEIRTKFGSSAAGVMKLLDPVGVSTDPKTTEASATYKVTVTMTGRTITYDQAHLQDAIRAAFRPQLLPGQALADTEIIGLTRTSDPELTIKVTARGTASVSAQDGSVQPVVFAGKTAAEISRQLLETSRFADVTVRIRPRWQRTVPAQANRIEVILKNPAP